MQVTNLTNGKQIIVKVNDRGPFEANRIIDLSYVAAKKLGMLGHGTTRVDVKAIDPRDAMAHPELLAKKTQVHHYLTQTTQIQTASNQVQVHQRVTEVTHVKTESQTIPATLKTVYIQVGAFRSRQHAERLRNRLSDLLGAPVGINSTHSSLYRVQVGPFTDVATAERVSKKLKSLGMHAKRVNDDFAVT